MSSTPLRNDVQYTRLTHQPEKSILTYKGSDYTAELTVTECNSKQMELHTFLIYEDNPDMVRKVGWKQSVLLLMARALIGLRVLENIPDARKQNVVLPKIDIIGPHLSYVKDICVYLQNGRIYVFLYDPRMIRTKFSAYGELDNFILKNECARSLRRLRPTGARMAPA